MVSLSLSLYLSEVPILLTLAGREIFMDWTMILDVTWPMATTVGVSKGTQNGVPTDNSACLLFNYPL